jgi:hypothetical protein
MRAALTSLWLKFGFAVVAVLRLAELDARKRSFNI